MVFNWMIHNRSEKRTSSQYGFGYKIKLSHQIDEHQSFTYLRITSNFHLLCLVYFLEIEFFYKINV